MKVFRHKKTLILLCLLFSSVSFAEETILPPTTESNETTYQEAERLYLNGKSDQALSLLEKFLQAAPPTTDPSSIVRARNLRGLMLFQSKKTPLALNEFEVAVQIANRNLSPTDSLLHLTRYNLGNAQFQLGKNDDAYESLSQINPEALDIDTRMRFYHLSGNIDVSRNTYKEAIGNYLLASSLAKDIGIRDTFIHKAYNNSKKIFLKEPQSEISYLKEIKLPEQSVSHWAREVLLAKGFMHLGKLEEATDHLKDFSSNAALDNPLRLQAEEMLSDLSKISDVNPKSIGILLPLSGRFGKFGKMCLNAITMAMKGYDQSLETSPLDQFSLIIKDSGETAESAQKAFEELVKEEKVVSIIGPLLSKQFSTVARKSQEFGVPLFSLSQKIDSEAAGSFIYPVSLTPQKQIELIVDRAVNVNGYKKFAILAPDDSFGDEYVNLFWDSVEKLGGEITGIERYPSKSTDFREEISRLLGIPYIESRSIEVAELKKRQERFASTLKVRGRLRQRYLQTFEPKGIAQFDAIFVPDDPSTVGQIAPSLAVQDIENVPFLGINTWNTMELVQRAGRYLQKSLFVDAFYASSKDPKTIEFVQEYMKLFQSIPGTIEVQAYDATAILLDVLLNSKVEQRNQVKDYLLSKSTFDGISGTYKFTSEGVSRDARLLTVKGNSILEISSRSPSNDTIN